MAFTDFFLLIFVVQFAMYLFTQVDIIAAAIGSFIVAAFATGSFVIIDAIHSWLVS